LRETLCTINYREGVGINYAGERSAKTAQKAYEEGPGDSHNGEAMYNGPSPELPGQELDRF